MFDPAKLEAARNWLYDYVEMDDAPYDESKARICMTLVRGLAVGAMKPTDPNFRLGMKNIGLHNQRDIGLVVREVRVILQIPKRKEHEHVPIPEDFVRSLSN